MSQIKVVLRLQSGLRQMILHTWCLHVPRSLLLPSLIMNILNLTVIVCTIVHQNQIEFCIAI